jgi:hypothetical protein
MIKDASNLDYWAEKLGLNQISDEIYDKTKISLIGKIHELASNSQLSSVFEVEIKKLLRENYPGLSEFMSRIDVARNSGNLQGVRDAKTAFGAFNTVKVQQFIAFANHVHRYYCKHSSEDACTYCESHQFPSLEYYEGQSLQERLDEECSCEGVNGDLSEELEPLKVLKTKSLKGRERKADK